MAVYGQTQIVQKPRFEQLVAGQPIIFVVENNQVVADEIRVKHSARLFISEADTVSTAAEYKIGDFKTTPNNTGAGIFDFSDLLQSYVSADNEIWTNPFGDPNGANAEYKQVDVSENKPVPIHMVDKFSRSTNSTVWFKIQFRTEWYDTTTNTVIHTNTTVNSVNYVLYNGYLKHTDVIERKGGVYDVDLGYDLRDKFRLSSDSKQFMTNAPLYQYANQFDYMTMSIMLLEDIYQANSIGVNKIKFQRYDHSGSTVGGAHYHYITGSTDGGFSSNTNNTNFNFVYNKQIFFGCGPANLNQASATFDCNPDSVSFYTIRAEGSSGQNLSQQYRIYINCPTTKGFEPIRLTWLNQWGAWDYYTFTMKSVRKLSTKSTKYQPLQGQWNRGTYQIASHRGGKKTFRVNSSEMIKINTDFVTEEESAWFEELMNSPEVYIIEQKQTDQTHSALNQYVTPVTLKTTSYTRKTVANDKLIQYTFDIEKTKTLRTQSV